MNANEAKKIIKAVLGKHGLTNKLTARTVGFIDLARDSCVFVCIHGWQPSPIVDEIGQVARLNGFRVEFKIS